MKPLGKERKTRIIAIANQKGGVGKTTTVINLSACLAQLGKKILVIDLDPQANATSGLGLPPQKGSSMYQAMLGQENAVGLICKTNVKNIDIIPSELDLAGSEVDVARMDNYLHCFKNALAPLFEKGAVRSKKKKYDYIFIDCPPSLGILTMNALASADSVIIPMQCEYYALEGLSVIARLLERLREGNANPNIEIEGVLMTMFDSRTRLAAEVIKEVRKHFRKKVFKTLIPRNVRLSEAPSFGKPVIQYDRSSKGSKAYMKLAKEFLKRTSKR
ncbi:ParA family protein [Verrucomicrobiota bacterium]